MGKWTREGGGKLKGRNQRIVINCSVNQLFCKVKFIKVNSTEKVSTMLIDC